MPVTVPNPDWESAASLATSDPRIYDSDQKRIAILEDLVELLHYRDLLWSLVKRDLTVRYKRSTLGFFWSMLNPLLMMVVLTIVFTRFIQFGIESYAVYLLSGILLWNFFSQATTQAMTSLVWGGGLLNKIYVPKSVFVLSAVLVGLINLSLALIPLALIMLVTRHPFSWALLFLPVSMFLTALFTFGIALIVSALAVFFVDVMDIYQFGLMVVMYLTPLFYSPSMIPPGYIGLLRFNPIFYFVEVFRQPIYQGSLPELDTLGWAVLLAAGAFGVGWFFFTRKADEFAYRA